MELLSAGPGYVSTYPSNGISFIGVIQLSLGLQVHGIPPLTHHYVGFVCICVLGVSVYVYLGAICINVIIVIIVLRA